MIVNFSDFLNENIDVYKKRKEIFINSIKSFKDINTDDRIRKVISYFGHEGYDYEEDAFEDFKDKVKDWCNFPNPVKLYRVIGVKEKELCG